MTMFYKKNISLCLKLGSKRMQYLSTNESCVIQDYYVFLIHSAIGLLNDKFDYHINLKAYAIVEYFTEQTLRRRVT